MKIINEISKKEEKQIKNLAINIDMVNGFVKEGALAAPSIMRVVPRQIELLDEYLDGEDKAIFFIRDEHTKDSVEFKTFGTHCLQGTSETSVIDELKKYYQNAYDFTKNSTNFVFAPGFREQIERLENLRTVLLMGCLSEVCVKNGGIALRNYFDQINRDIDIYVAEDAIDTFDAPGHNAEEVTERAIDDMKANGIKVLAKKEGEVRNGNI